MVVLNNISQTQKDKNYMFSLKCGIKTDNMKVEGNLLEKEKREWGREGGG
jgi:hypothetical protein